MTTLNTVWCRLVLPGLLCIGLASCGGSPGTALPPAPVAPGSPSASGSVVPSENSATGASPSRSAAPAESQVPAESQAPDAGGGTAAGDVPDNAVFLIYQQANLGFSIQYVEGWQVTTQPYGVLIRDKDSSETVSISAPQADIPGYVASTDLPSLQVQSHFKLLKQDKVEVGGSSYVHLAYHLPAPPDPVTGKQVPSTVDRYYVPGPNGLAIVSLSTPDGVDNVDAFRQMIESFKWG